MFVRLGLHRHIQFNNVKCDFANPTAIGLKFCYSQRANTALVAVVTSEDA